MSRAALAGALSFFAASSAALAQTSGAVTSTAPTLTPVQAPPSATPGQSAQSEAAPPASGDQAGKVQEIVVTAQRREQSLQKVPIAVTALGADTIKTERIENVQDLSAIAPDLTVRPSGGGAQIPVYTIRGILAGDAAPGTDRGVSLYIDGVYIQKVVGSVFDFADIERIEVLKGPQGTLFGRNATGGAISVITKDPPGKWGFHQELTGGNYDQFRSKTHLDLPSFGPIAASFTYLHSERRGDVKNSGAGTQLNYAPATNGALGLQTSPKYLGDDDTNSVSAAVKFDFDPKLSLVYKFDYSEDHYTPTAEGIDLLSDSNSIVGEVYNESPNPKTPISEVRPNSVNNSFTDPAVNRTIGSLITAKYRFNDNISVKNIASYRAASNITFFQLDGLGGLTNSPVNFGPVAGLPFPLFLPIGFALNATGDPRLASTAVNAPFSLLSNASQEHDHQFSDELQLIASYKLFDMTIGYLHFFSSQKDEGINELFPTYQFLAFDGQNTSAAGTPGVIPANPGYLSTHVAVNSDALYAQPEIHITPQLDIVGGARGTIDKKKGFESIPDQFLAGNTTGLNTATSPINYYDVEGTYLGGVNYRPLPNVLTYVKWSTGYISGGELATIAFKPERAYSWEIGAKSELFDHRLRSNLSIFNAKYKSIQYDTAGILTGVPAASSFGQAVVPSGDAHARGFEWENTAVPIRGVTLTANAGYTDFHFVKASIFPGFADASGAPGYQVFDRPKWTAELAGQYDSPEVFLGGHVLARVDANFRDRELLNSDIAPGNGPTAMADPAIVKASTSPEVTLVNGRLGLTNMQYHGARLEVAVWARNILNDGRITQNVALDLGPIGYDSSVIYQPARTFGIDVIADF